MVLAARNREKLEEVAAEIRAAGREAFVVELDLASPESIKEAFATAAKDFGRIDILVNNAGITKDGLALRMKKDDWDAVLNTNLTGAFLAIQQVLHGMMRERWGRIINISSVVGEAGNVGQANYVASKAGLIGLTKSLAQEMASRNITVNAVAPGFIETDMTGALSDEVKAALLARIPLKRMGNRRGRRGGSGVPGERRGRLHHRARARRQRRNADVRTHAAVGSAAMRRRR